MACRASLDIVARMGDGHRTMRYDEFMRLWHAGMSAAKLHRQHSTTESIEVGGMDRCFETYVEPSGGQQTPPFYVTAKLSFAWSALQERRATYSEEQVVRDVMGDEGEAQDTERPWLRIDVGLSATVTNGVALPFPSKAQCETWIRAVRRRLEGAERLLADDVVEERDDGKLAILAWQDEPKLEVSVRGDGSLALHAVSLEAWQSVRLPRRWEDSSRDDDPSPDLAAMFHRVRTSMQAWMESLDHLRV